MKVHSGNYSAWQVKIIWKLQDQFADAKINWLTGSHYTSSFIHYCTFKILYRKKTAKISLSFYKHHQFLPLIHVGRIQNLLEKSYAYSFVLLLSNKLTYSLSTRPLCTFMWLDFCYVIAKLLLSVLSFNCLPFISFFKKSRVFLSYSLKWLQRN